VTYRWAVVVYQQWRAVHCCEWHTVDPVITRHVFICDHALVSSKHCTVQRRAITADLAYSQDLDFLGDELASPYDATGLHNVQLMMPWSDAEFRTSRLVLTAELSNRSWDRQTRTEICRRVLHNCALQIDIHLLTYLQKDMMSRADGRCCRQR